MNSTTAIACILGAAACTHAQPTFTGIGDLPGGLVSSLASGISADGQTVIGRSSGIVAGIAANSAFRWTQAGGMVPLIMPAGWQNASDPVGVSDDGSVIAGNAYSAAGSSRAFIWTITAGASLTGGIGGNTYGEAYDLSADSADGSVVVGWSNGYNPDAHQSQPVGTRWTASAGISPLGWLPGANNCVASAISRDGSVIFGSCFGDGGPGSAYGQIFRWTQAGGIAPLDIVQGVGWGASAASTDGSIVCGYVVIPVGRTLMMRWSAATGPLILNNFIDTYSSNSALGMSPDGEAIVGYVGTGNLKHPVIWTAFTGQVLLEPHLLARYGYHTPAGWTLLRATGMSADKRVIVGEGTNPSGNPEGWVLRLPLPLGCYPNCDTSSTAPILNVNDFQCFLNRFSAGDSYANCDGSAVAPTLNINDFQCFLNAFVVGCP